MAKGGARILLHGKKSYLIESLKKFKALHEIAAALELAGVKVSISSLYRFMVSDLSEEYAEYLHYTGRGLVSSRYAKAGAKPKPASDLAAKRERITNPSDMKKFLIERQ
ncbi:MAG: hypothetical protein CML01_21485 [Pseudomonas sp.]|nr:hypothetical protein [Pseudomonas sp.]|tara:strand:+ start:517 stop:843 length:327 start_codon:yes stop_codon:yes gene_type:complete